MIGRLVEMQGTPETAFTDDEKIRLSGLIEKGGIVAHIIKTYVVDTVEYS